MTLYSSKLEGLKIGILGCGWLGSRMTRLWMTDNIIYTTTTTKEKMENLANNGLHPTLVDFSEEVQENENLEWEAVKLLDVLIITVGISTRKDKDIENIKVKLNNLKTFLGDFNGQIFYLSSTSVYPNENKTFKEEDVPLERVFVENTLRKQYPKINILRLGGLMGDDRYLSKYNVSNLDCPVNHIHYSDIIGVIEKMIEVKSFARLYNVVAPLHPTKREVIAKQKGQEFSPEDFDCIAAKMVSSKKLEEELGYQFKYQNPNSFHISFG